MQDDRTCLTCFYSVSHPTAKSLVICLRFPREEVKKPGGWCGEYVMARLDAPKAGIPKPKAKQKARKDAEGV